MARKQIDLCSGLKRVLNWRVVVEAARIRNCAMTVDHKAHPRLSVDPRPSSVLLPCALLLEESPPPRPIGSSTGFELGWRETTESSGAVEEGQ